MVFPGTPLSGVLRSSPQEPLPDLNLAFEYCAGCGVLRRRNQDSPPDYAGKPRATARQLPAYLDYLLSLIHDAADKTNVIAEIGSNDGTFLDLLCREGYSRSYGVEPSAHLAKTARSKGLTITEEYFGPEAVGPLLDRHGAPTLVLCRHTLEHVPDPLGFVRALAALLKPGEGTALIEVPDSAIIAERLSFVELWDEHLYYFTLRTLRRLFERSGLTVLSEAVFPHLDTRNILIHLSADEHPGRMSQTTADAQEVRMWASFSARFRQAAERIRGAIFALPRPLYLVGASHPQCNFVNYLGIEAVVDFMVDDDSAKVGRLPPIRSQTTRIISSEEFARRADRGALVLTGFGYPGWTRRLREIGAGKGLAILAPHDALFQAPVAEPDNE